MLKRNIANRGLLQNAAAVVANIGNSGKGNIAERGTLYYPGLMLKKMTIRA